MVHFLTTNKLSELYVRSTSKDPSILQAQTYNERKEIYFFYVSSRNQFLKLNRRSDDFFYFDRRDWDNGRAPIRPSKTLRTCQKWTTKSMFSKFQHECKLLNECALFLAINRSEIVVLPVLSFFLSPIGILEVTLSTHCVLYREPVRSRLITQSGLSKMWTNEQ